MCRSYLFWLLLITMAYPSMVLADIFHYNNTLVGERAMGLGGAYTAIADDASGVFYNPSGMAFAASSEVSGSANAFFRRKIRYKTTIGQDDFFERSKEGTTTPFFGLMQNLKDFHDGLVVGFGLYTTDSELKNQNDLIVNPNLGLRRFHRTANVRASTTGFGLGVAQRLNHSFALGGSIHGIYIDELTQEYQHVTYTDGRYLNQNVRSHLEVTGLEISLGAQYALNSLSFGINLKIRSIVEEGFDDGYDLTLNFDDRFTQTYETLPVPLQIFRNNKIEEPLGHLPLELRMGVAWFVSARLLASFDISYTGEAKEGDSRYDRESVTNFATGAEYYITPSVPIRVGLFTNNDARKPVVAGKSNQPDHIDYTGMSLFFVFVQPNSQIAIGTIYQAGSGKAQKTTGSAIQDVEAESITVAFSATQSF